MIRYLLLLAHIVSINLLTFLTASTALAYAPATTAGLNHSLALRDDGTVWAWGGNDYGQLGDGSTAAKSTPAQITGLDRVTAISAGHNFSLALRDDGSVWAWGANKEGQLGDGSTIDRLTPVPVTGVNTISALYTGNFHALALRADGTLWSWGANWNGQLGDGTTTARHSPVQVSGLDRVTSAAAGAWYSLARRDDGSVWAWGSNWNGQLGDGTTDDRFLPSAVSGLSRITGIAAGAWFAMALREDGTLWTWGDNSNGQLGDGSTTERHLPIQTVDLDKVTRIAAGSTHAVALRSDGTIRTWGANWAGQLGDGTTTDRLRASGSGFAWFDQVKAIAAGNGHTLVLKNDNSLWGWGDNTNGQLGDGETSRVHLPSLVPGHDQVKAIAAGNSHTLTIRNDGKVWAWGSNYSGELGDGTATFRKTAKEVTGLSGAAIAAAGVYYSLARGDDGAVWTWGENTDGQLGDGATSPHNTPTQLVGISQAKALAAGNAHTLVLRTDGTVWAWGANWSGQLGDGSQTTRTTPTTIANSSNLTAVAAGQSHSLALRDDGTVLAWGANSSGQLGDGTTNERHTPQAVPGLDHVIAIAAGSNHSLALRNDGTIWAWGSNWAGQLGDGTTTDRHTPTLIANLDQISAISAGSDHSLALRTGGRIWAWGSNWAGQLGDGSASERRSPTLIAGLDHVIAVAAGQSHTVVLRQDGTVWTWGSNQTGQLGFITGGLNPVRGFFNGATPDADHDGTPDSLDGCKNDPNKTAPDLCGCGKVESSQDRDKDGMPDCIDPDDDNDGMPDEWESAFGLDSFSADGNSDMDNDGLVNIDEYFSHTDPAKTNPVISGRVTDQAGKELSGILVEVWQMSDKEKRFTAATSNNGYYRLPVAPALDYLVVAGREGSLQSVYFNNTSNWRQASLVDASRGSATGIDFILPTGLAISGTITNLALGVSATISAWSPATGAWSATSLTGTGDPLPYTLQGLAPGADYEITVSAPGYVDGFLKANGSLVAWQEAARFTAGRLATDVSLVKGGTLSGTINGLTAGDEAVITAQSDLTGQGATTTILSSGVADNYTITGLPTGVTDYRVFIRADRYAGGYYRAGASQPVAYPRASKVSADQSGINFILVAGFAISGTVTGLGSGDAAVIQVSSDSTWNWGEAVLTGSGGGVDPYTLSGLPTAADYRIRILADGYSDGYYAATGIVSQDEAEPLALTHDKEGINFTLAKGTLIAGIITNLSQGVTAHLEAWSETEKSWSGTTVFGTGEAVAYTITGLTAAADYVVHFRPGGYPEQQRQTIDSSTNPGHVHFTVPSGKTIAGTLTNGTAREIVILQAHSDATGVEAALALLVAGSEAVPYTLAGLPAAADYTVTIVTGGQVLRQTGIDLANAVSARADFNLAQAVYNVTGEVTGLIDDSPVRINLWSPTTTAGVTLLGNDHFSLALPAGSYWLTIHATGCRDAFFAAKGSPLTDTLPAGPPLLPQNDPALGIIDLAAFAGHPLSGYVYLGGAAKTVANVFVEVLIGSRHQGAFTNGKGYYEIEGLADGTYSVRAWSAVGISVPAQVTVNGAAASLDLTLGGQQAATLASKVMRSGLVVRDAMVLLFDKNTGAFLNALVTDGQGEFSFTGLEAKEYALTIDSDGNGLPEPLLGGATSLTVTAGAAPPAIVLQ